VIKKTLLSSQLLALAVFTQLSNLTVAYKKAGWTTVQKSNYTEYVIYTAETNYINCVCVCVTSHPFDLGLEAGDK
jgi:hypothetical protein